MKSRVLGTLFPLPIIYCCRIISRGSSAGNRTSDRERPTGCSQRENSTLLSFSLFCQFIKAWALRPKRKIPNSLLLRMHSLFAIHVYVAGVQSSKKTPENTSTFFFLKTNKNLFKLKKPYRFEFPSLLFCYWPSSLSYRFRLPADSGREIHLGSC